MTILSRPARLSLVIGAILLLTGLFVTGPLAARAKDLAVTVEQLQHLRITLDEVRSANSEAVAVLPATAIPPPNGRHAISAPFAGTVAHSDVLVGQHIKKGQALVTIASRDVLEAMSRLKQSEAELQAAEAVADRYRYLADRNITARNRAEETAAQASKARAVVDQHRRLSTINSIKVNDDGSYTLFAPSDGRVVEARVTPGASLEAMAPAVVFDNTQELWLEAQVPASLIGRINVGDAIVAGKVEGGRVVSIGGALDQMTRSAMMLVSLPMGSGLVSGQMVTLTVLHEAPSNAVSVPRSAVSVIGGEPVVFVRTSDGFAPTPVKVRGRSTELATIEGDLKPGQQVASSGLAQLEKMQAGE